MSDTADAVSASDCESVPPHDRHGGNPAPSHAHKRKFGQHGGWFQRTVTSAQAYANERWGKIAVHS